MKENLEKEMGLVESLVDKLIQRNEDLKKQFHLSAEKALTSHRKQAIDGLDEQNKALQKENTALQEELLQCQNREKRMREMLYIVRQNIETCLEEKSAAEKLSESPQTAATVAKAAVEQKTESLNKHLDEDASQADTIEVVSKKEAEKEEPKKAEAEAAPVSVFAQQANTEKNSKQEDASSYIQENASWLEADESDPFASEADNNDSKMPAGPANTKDSSSITSNDDEFFKAIS